MAQRLAWVTISTLCVFCAQSVECLRPGNVAVINAFKAPVFPDSYEMQYTLTLPFVETMQSGGLSYPVHVWYDGPAEKLRMDVYDGMDSVYIIPGLQYSIYPRLKEQVCDLDNTTTGPTFAGKSLAGKPLQDEEGGFAPPLPDVSSWEYAGTARVGSKHALVWSSNLRIGEKVESYKLMATEEGKPLKLIMMGMNLITGSHYDEYVLDFTHFKPGKIHSKVFRPPQLCDEAVASTHATGLTSAARAIQLMSLLPASITGTRQAIPKAVPGPYMQGIFSDSPLTVIAASWQFISSIGHHLWQAAGVVSLGSPSIISADTAVGTRQVDHTYLSEPAQKRPQLSARVMNEQLVQQSNAARPSKSYKLAMNRFAAASHEHFAATSLGLGPSSLHTASIASSDGRISGSSSSGSSSSTGSSGSHSVSAPHKGTGSLGTYKRTLTDAELPASVDWRGTGADGGVKDQASCGSCWAFSAVGAMQAAHWVATGESLSFSEQQIVDCSWKYGNNSGCGGGWMEPALDYVLAHGGAASEETYPYLGQNGYCRSANSAPRIASFKGYTNVPSNDESALMEAVALHGPVAVSIDAKHPEFKFYSEGVFYDSTCGTTQDRMNHAVLLMGYGTDKASGLDYWIIRNSWSAYWGEDGYVKIARKGNDCGVSLDAMFVVVDKVSKQGAVN